MSAYHECDFGSLVRYNPAAYPILRRWLSFAVQRPWYCPVWILNIAARLLYEFAHPRGAVGRLLGRRMPTGPMLDPWGQSYMPTAKGPTSSSFTKNP